MARRRSSGRSYKRSYKSKPRARASRSMRGPQRIVIQVQATPAPGIMADPLGGSELVMPGQPRVRRARF